MCYNMTLGAMTALLLQVVVQSANPETSLFFVGAEMKFANHDIP